MLAIDAVAFGANREKRNAVLWSLVIIGEAAGKLSAATQEAFVGVPWEQVRGFRNRVVHGYFTLQWPIVWEIASVHVPVLRAEAERILRERFPLTYRRMREGGPLT